MPPESIILTDSLEKRFGDKAGVFDLTLEIPEGKIVGFVGPSGSGKTTTVRLMTGLLAPDSGMVEVLGSVPVDFDADTRGRIGYMPQHSLLYPDLTLTQNLRFAASLYGLGRKARERMNDLVEFLGLEGAMNRLPEQASGGEQRRLMLASTLAHAPELMFLDEPTAGIDPILRRRIWDRLEEVSDRGASLVVTTQYVGEAAYCDYVAVLAEGRMIAFETPEGLRRAAYGGELMDVRFAHPPDRRAITHLEQAVDGRRLEMVDDHTVRLVVEDAGAAGPMVNQWATEVDAAVTENEAHVPSFDDVFVVLVDKLLESDDTVGAGSQETGRHLE